jgi:hypothetical protein
VSVDSVARGKVPRKLKKTLVCAVILFILGVVLLAVGIEENVRTERWLRGLPFYVLCLIVLIPGGFYTYQFCRAKVEKDVDERREILSKIPEL